MSASPAILPPASIGEAVRPLGFLSDAEFDKVLAVISGPASFSPSSKEVSSLEKEVPSLSANLGFLLAALSYLTRQAERFQDAGRSADTILQSLIDELELDAKWDAAKPIAARRLETIIGKRDLLRSTRKIKRLQSGFLPNATAFSSFVDVRPNFNESLDQIEGMLPMIQFRVATDSEAGAEKEYVFQLSEAALVLLKDTIENVEKKLAFLRSSGHLKV